MSMAAGQALMLKLGTQLSAISVKGMSLDTIKGSLKSTAMSSSLFALKIDSGEFKDWLVKEAVQNQNPTIVDPNYPDENDPHNMGFFASEAKLREKYLTGNANDYAFVKNVKWIWDTEITQQHPNPDWRATSEVLQTPKSFNSQSEASTYQDNNNLYTYTYSETETSTISITTIMDSPDEASSEKVDEMADLLGPDCLAENNRTWSLKSPRKPTPAEFKSVIESKILSFS